MKTIWLVCILVFFTWLAGCAPPGPPAVSTLAVPVGRTAVFTEVVPALTASPTETRPALTPVSSRTPEPAGNDLVVDGAPPTKLTEEPASIPPDILAAKPGPVAVCSPLAEHTLADLRLIVSAPYAPPPPGREERHHGMDFAYFNQRDRQTIQGEGVQAVLSGVVAAALDDTFPYGNLVIIETTEDLLPPGLAEKIGLQPGESLYTLFAHLDSTPEVALGQAVAACQAIGEAGKSGNAGVAHLHLETRLGPAGQTFTEMEFYTPEASPEARDAYLLWRTSKTFRHFDPNLVLAP